MPKPIYMVSLRFDMSQFFTKGKSNFGGQIDTGYSVHCRLKELFQDLAPQPFLMMPGKDRWMDVLAYSPNSAEQLREHARGAGRGDPKLVDWERFCSKAMPEKFPTGLRLGFETRICPVIRKSSDGKIYKAKSEIDAFLAATENLEKSVSVSREQVYCEWFEKAINRLGGAEIHTSQIESLRRVHLIRRDKERSRKRLERPDVTIKGVLSVTDSEAFRDLLMRGVGRHRAFGFGMLLLKPERGS